MLFRSPQEAKVNSLDQMTSSTISTRNVAMNMFESLVTRDENMNPIPELAAEVVEAPDGMMYTFKLRQGVKFHNGKEMTSADVKYSFERVTGRGGIQAATSDAQLLSMVQSVETPDERTVTFKLKEPYGAFAQVLADVRALPLLPAETTKSFDPARQMAGSGPFALKAYEPGATITYARNNDWHLGNDRPFLDGIEMSIIRDAPAALAQFLGGALDALPLLPVDLKKAKDGVKGLVIDQSAPLMIQNITFSGLDF